MNAAERQQLTDAIVAQLPGTQAEIARAVGRKPSDGTVRRRLAALAEEGLVVQSDDGWRRAGGLPELPGFEFPGHFDEEARAVFESRLVAASNDGVWADEDVDLLERYVSAGQRGRTMQAEVAAGGAFSHSEESGRAYAHPGIRIIREAERDAHVYEEALIERQRRRANADPGDDED